MKFLTPAEAGDWLKFYAGSAESVDEKGTSGLSFETWKSPVLSARMLFFARILQGLVEGRGRSLLLPTGWNIWASSENWHAYYRIRKSYGDLRFIEDAPGHLFLEHEASDLVTFLHFGVTFGWDFQLLAEDSRVRIFVSHDEWFRISASDDELLSRIVDEMSSANLQKL
jgi:hypothetical protein